MSRQAVRAVVPNLSVAGTVLLLECMRNNLVRFFTTALLAGSLAVFAGAQQPDNTKANKGEHPTADQAKNNASDRDSMQKIRQAIASDKSLSTYAHNVKVISKNGKVTLKGPVRSEEEKRSIEAKAEEVAGKGNVVNDLTVKPEKANRSRQAEQEPKQ
jgi:osmotically-inducible protein OsmY